MLSSILPFMTTWKIKLLMILTSLTPKSSTMKPFVQQSKKASFTFFDQVLHGATPAKPLFENDSAALVLNLLQARPGHALIIAKKPVARLAELSIKETNDIMLLARQYQKFWRGLPDHKEQNFDFCLYLNDGRNAGQTVPRFHLHIVPINFNDPLPDARMRTVIDPSGKSFIHHDILARLPKEEKLSLLKKAYSFINKNVDYLKQFVQQNQLDSRYHFFGDINVAELKQYKDLKAELIRKNQES
jgi:diadenosine tetraphosphate (Ap4A) HIT family hydrolase